MAFDPSFCEGCPIQGKHRPSQPIGGEEARFLVVTDRPTQAAARQGRLMNEAAMRVFSEDAQRLGFGRSDFRFTPMCHCAYDPNDHHNKEKTAIHKHCRVHLLREIELGGAEVVVPLGADATSQTFGKATKITRVKGIGHNVETIDKPVFPLMSPGIVSKYPQNAPMFRADMDSFGRYVDAGYDADQSSAMEDGNVEYEEVTDLQFLIDRMESEGLELISFDTENTGLRWYQQGCDVRSYRPHLHRGNPLFKPKFQILTMQFCIEPGKAYLLVWDHPERPVAERLKPKLRNQVRQLLCNENHIVIGQNTKYDNMALWMTEGIRFRIGGDTQMLATLVDENQLEKNLDVLTKLYVPEMAGYADRFNATVNKERMWETPLAQITPYGCGDTDAVMRVYNVVEPMVMEDEKQWNHYCKVSIPGLNAFSGLESRGMYTDDTGALAEFKVLMQREVAEKKAALLRDIPTVVKRDVVQDYVAKGNKGDDAAEKALSFTRAEFVKQVLFHHPRGFRLKPKVFTKSTAFLNDTSLREPSVSAKDHLPFFFEEEPFTERLADFVKDDSLLSKSVVNFEQKYIVGGKVRPIYNLHKAVTGRTSSEDPNGQNYPKRGARAKAYRKMFVAPEGWYVFEADLSQAELRIAASMAKDRTMIDIYRSGGDIHMATACIVLGVTEEAFAELDKATKKDGRQKAKAVNFGFLYGMGWRKFINYAKTQYGVEFTEAEARRVREGFFRKYKSLAAWHKAMRDFAGAHKYVRSFSGRVRHLPMIDSPEEGVRMEAERQAINSPVQEFGSAIGVMALGRMNEEIDSEYLPMVGFVHDALVGYCRKEHIDWALKTVKRYMQTTPIKEWFNVELPVPLVADVGFGENLGEIIEVADFGEFKLDQPFDFTKIVNKEGVRMIEVPRQVIPPNNGRLTRSAYTTIDDLEDEDNYRDVVVRPRVLFGVVSKASQKREVRSQKQMVINRRNAQARLNAQRAERASPGPVIIRRRR